MELKIALNYFKGKQALVVENIPERLTVALKEKMLVIVYTNDQRCMIAHNGDTDIRFAGRIENLQQLKMVLKMVTDLIE